MPSNRPALLQTPPDWQRLPVGQNTFNPRPQLVLPRHPFARPAFQHHPPFQRPQRPLTYGEYRKMREDYERRFMPHRMPSPTPSQSEMSPDSSSEKATTEPAAASTTAASGPSVSRRDPRLQPKETPQQVEQAMPPDHSSVAAGKTKSLFRRQWQVDGFGRIMPPF